MSIVVKAKYKKGFFARKVHVDEVMQKLSEISKNSYYEVRFFRIQDNSYAMQFVPTGVATITMTDTTISVESTISQAGPGFHAALLQVLDMLAKELNIAFDYTDDTDYVYNKAFMHLQKCYVDDLRKTIEHVVDTCKNEEVVDAGILGYSHPFFPTKQKDILTLLGSYTIDELQSYLDGDFEEFARKYFMWYEEGTGALYCKKLAEFSLWNYYKWRRPMNSEEANIATNIVRYLEKARMIDNDILLPCNAWKEICSYNGLPYLNFNEAAEEDDSNIGYLRNKVQHILPLNYRLEIEGTFARNDTEQAIILTDFGRQVMIHIVPEMQSGQISDPRQMLEKIDFEKEINGYIFVGMWQEEVAPDQSKVYVLNSFIQGSTSFANVVVRFNRKEDTTWAEELITSFITPPAPPISLSMFN